MDESGLTAVLAALILVLVWSDTNWFWLGAVALIPLASKVPDPL